MLSTYIRSTWRDRRRIILYNPEKRLHGLQSMVWRLALEKFNNDATQTPMDHVASRNQ